jgi:hypothetical protein
VRPTESSKRAVDDVFVGSAPMIAIVVGIINAVLAAARTRVMTKPTRA